MALSSQCPHTSRKRIPTDRPTESNLGPRLVCTYARMHVCMYACMHVCIHACMHVQRQVCMHVRMCMGNACMHACMHACLYICMSALHRPACMHAQICMHVCMHKCMHACMYACMYVVRTRSTCVYIHVGSGGTSSYLPVFTYECGWLRSVSDLMESRSTGGAIRLSLLLSYSSMEVASTADSSVLFFRSLRVISFNTHDSSSAR